MNTRLFPLALENVHGWLRRTPFAVIFVGDRPSTALLSASLFGALRDRVGAANLGTGFVRRQAPVREALWTAVWRTKVGPFCRQMPPPEGLYLFFEGVIVSYAALPVSSDTSDPAWGRIQDLFIEKVKLETSDTGDDPTWKVASATDRGRPPGERPPMPPPPASSYDSAPATASGGLSLRAGPYAVLGVPATASNEEVRAAYRAAVKKNHPDRLRHMSEEIQAFAEERTRVIMEAWDLIAAYRGIR